MKTFASRLAALLLATFALLACGPALAYALHDNMYRGGAQSISGTSWLGNRIAIRGEAFRVTEVVVSAGSAFDSPTPLAMRLCAGSTAVPAGPCADFTANMAGAGWWVFRGQFDAPADSELWVMFGLPEPRQGSYHIDDTRQGSLGVRSSDGGATWSTGHTTLSMRVSGDTAYPPAISALSPPLGPTAGGTSVVITGRNLFYVDSVRFGGTPASFTKQNNVQLTAIAPPGVGSVDVSVQGTYGSASGARFTYADHPAPVIAGVSPPQGPADGGNQVVVTGSHFHGVTAVRFNGRAASFTPDPNDGARLIVEPPYNPPGTTTMEVATPYGTASSPYTYIATPIATGFAPGHGPAGGGTQVAITGSHFTHATAVRFGGSPASQFTVVNDALIEATAPASPLPGGAPGTVAITVETAGGSATASGFQYLVPPQVEGVSPGFIAASGGPVTISGRHLATATGVTFGGVPASGFAVVNDGQIHATAPAHAPGPVPVQVHTLGGVHALADALRYVGPPDLTAVSPATAATAGGTRVTLGGAGLASATAVHFGGVAAAGFSVDSDTQITATAPAHAAGSVAVAVTTAGGTATRADAITYVTRTDGACGAAAGQPRITTPTAGLCGAGQPGAVQSANGAYTWACAGEHGGSDAGQCSAPWAAMGAGQGTVQADAANGWRIDAAAFEPTLPAPLPRGAGTAFVPLALTLAGGTHSASVTVHYTQPVPQGAVYLKYGPSPDGLDCSGAACAQPHWYRLPGAAFSADRLSVTFTLTDGGAGDSDGLPGRITDPGLPVLLAATPGGTQAIPALGGPALALLAALTALCGGLFIRRMLRF